MVDELTFMQNIGRGKAAKVVNIVAKWLNLCLSTVFQMIFTPSWSSCHKCVGCRKALEDSIWWHGNNTLATWDLGRH